RESLRFDESPSETKSDSPKLTIVTTRAPLRAGSKPATAKPRPSATETDAVSSSMSAFRTSVNSPSDRMTKGRLIRNRTGLISTFSTPNTSATPSKETPSPVYVMPDTSCVATHSAAALIRRRSRTCMAFLRKALERRFLVFVRVEDGGQFGKHQQIVEPFGHVQQLQRAAVLRGGDIALNQLAQPAAVHVRHRAEVEKELLLALLQQALHLVLQQHIAPRTQGDVAGHFYNRHVAYCPLVKLHGSSDPRKVQEGVIL